MAEQYLNLSIIRSYEISIWTLQDRFVSILKWATMDNKGEVQDPIVVLRDDGTQEFTFTIPQFYQEQFTRIPNPLWIHLDQQPLEANMHKLKVVFNKNTENEAILEFLVVSVTEDHARDEVDITVKTEGLAFHELGKTGYRISLSQENFEVIENEWFDNGYNSSTGQWAPRPLMNLQFWNDLIFKDSDGEWRTNWIYEVQMDWSAFSNSELNRYSDILYEDAYVSSWQLDSGDIKPRAVENLREKERPIEISESNYYNVTQTIAEQFGVFCRYEYEHNERYEIIGRKVIYYNNYIKDSEGHIDLTYPYSSQAVTCTSDNTSLTTKLYVRSVDDEEYGTLSIMNVDANRTKEDYILNFDYLIKIGAINEEQVDDLKQFERDIRFLNELLTQNQERTRIVQNQLITVSADVTYYDNALKLDKEQYAQAENLYNSIANPSGYVHLEKTFTVMEDTERGYGWYININVDGLDPNSVALYESRRSSTGANGVGYYNAIPSFQCATDEYGNVIRIQNIIRGSDEIDDSQIYLVGQHKPGSKYENIMNTWEQRKILDEKKYEEALEQEIDLTWYLYGSRVGYARVDGTRLDGEYCGIGLVWDAAMGPPPDANSRNYNQFITYTLEARILGNSNDVEQLLDQLEDRDITKITFDYFFDEDAENSTPDLTYYYEIYTKQKEKSVNAFERMMGPALREGYWQPEDYNDYGDVYYDNFELNQGPKTPYLSFLWDNTKYYEGEESVVYTSNTAGDVRQHLIVNLSNYLPDIKNHLNDLCFGYRDPIIYEAVEELNNTLLNLSQTQLNKIPENTKDNQYTILDADYVSVSKFKEYYSQNFLSSLTSGKGNLSDIESQHATEQTLKTNIINNDTSLTAEEKAKKKEELANLYHFNTNAEDIIARYNTVVSTINNLTDSFEYTASNLNQFLEKLELFKKDLDALRSQYQERSDIEKNIIRKISNPENYPPHSVSDKTSNSYPGHFEFFNNEIAKINNLYTLAEKMFNWYSYARSTYTQIEAIQGNTEGSYRTYGVGADCELGWIIDKNDSEQNPIPVLIVTGTDTLTEKIIQFIQTGTYTYTRNIPNEFNEQQSVDITVDMSDRAFIGYYPDEIKGADNGAYIQKLVVLNNNDFIGDASQTRITKDIDGISRPIESEDYLYQRVYPRLFFSTIKLRDSSSKLRIKINQQELFVNEDYYIVQDDRSKGLKVSGIGYYLTLRENVLYPYLCQRIAITFDVLYTLLNADTSIYLDAIKVSKENAYPKVSYEVQLSVLNPEFIQTAYNRLNQIVHINDNDLKLEDVSGYISSVTLKLDKPWEDTVEIKNYQTKFEDLFSTIVAQTEAMKKTEGGISNAVKAFNAYGFIDSDVLQDSMLKADLNLQFNKGTLTISQRDGIWGESELGVVAFRGGGIFTATTQDENGYWNWNTGILPTGINADLITSGQLDTNRIKIYAGNELRFQMNGSGLYAYKGYSEDDFAELTSQADSDERKQISAQLSESSKKQYLLYNSEGLFLRSEEGAYVLKKIPIFADSDKTIPVYETKTYTDLEGNIITYYTVDPVTGEKVQKTETKFDLVTSQVDRVEVSWDGLILRNWSGEKVFYADPDTGNLTLKGYVLAEGGKIGGWTLGTDRLTSNGISLISGPVNAAGIQLSPTGSRQNTVTDYANNRTLFIYNPVDSNDNVDVNTEYFLEYDSMYDLAKNRGDIVYISQLEISSVKPLYPVSLDNQTAGTPVNTATESGGMTAESNYQLVQTSSVEISASPLSYIKRSADATEYLKDINNQLIIYDPSDEQMSWFTKVQEKYNDYETFVEIQKVIVYTEYSLPNNITLRPSGTDKITFSVSAETGRVTILKGTLGNFEIKDDGLYNGAISRTEFKQDNVFKIGNNTHTFGELFYNFTLDEVGGVLTLYRVDGSSVNFNIAATSFYKNAIAAAGRLTLTLTVNGTSWEAQATTGTGEKKTANGTAGSDGATIKAVAKTMTASLTKDAEIGPSGSVTTTTSGADTGICENCERTCFRSCAKVCTASQGGDASHPVTPDCKVNCIGHCLATCSGTCTSDCGTGCSGGCGNGCGDGCGTSCGTVCNRSCGYGCATSCRNGCYETCNVSCGNGCGTTCRNTCADRCQVGCTSTNDVRVS